MNAPAQLPFQNYFTSGSPGRRAKQDLACLENTTETNLSGCADACLQFSSDTSATQPQIHYFKASLNSFMPLKTQVLLRMSPDMQLYCMKQLLSSISN